MQSSGRLFWDIEQGFRAFQWSAKCCFVEAIISRTKAGRLCYLTERCSPEPCMGCGAWQADFGSMWMCLCQKAAMRWFRFLQFLLKPHFFSVVESIRNSYIFITYQCSVILCQVSSRMESTETMYSTSDKISCTTFVQNISRPWVAML